MAEFTLFPSTGVSVANNFSSDQSITVQKIDNPYNFTLNIAEGDTVAANTEISISSNIDFDAFENINGVIDTPKVTVTYA